MRRVYTLLITLGLVMAWCGLAYGQTSERTKVELSDTLLLWGTVRCDNHNTPIIVIQKSIWGTPEFTKTLVHEMVHVEQIKKFGNCIKASERYRSDSTYRLNSELEAYMTQVSAAIGAGSVLDALVETIVYQLSNPYYDFTFPVDTLRERVKQAIARKLRDPPRR